MFDKSTYIGRRDGLKRAVGTGVILLPGNDNTPIDTVNYNYPFRQNGVFSYYTGINRIPAVSLLIDIDNDRETLFADDPSPEDQIWTGPVAPFRETAEKTGINRVKSSSELSAEIDRLKKGKRVVHYPPGCRSETLIKLGSLLDIPIRQVNRRASLKLIKAVVLQRESKTAEEISEIETALDISHEVYTTLFHLIRPGRTEKELLGAIASVLAANGSQSAFPEIVTSRGQILHNFSHDNILSKEDLLLADTGALSPEGYCSDITRTVPVSGRFTPRQKAMYNIVLTAQLTAIDSIKPGVLYRDVHLKTCSVIAQGLKEAAIMKGNMEDAVEAGAHAVFLPHGLGHMLGLDVHDMEVLGEDNVGYDDLIGRSDRFGLSSLRFARELKVNHVITVEPGIYFIPGLIKKWREENKFNEFIDYAELEEYLEFGGIRIEDDILVTPQGSRVLGRPIPKSAEEIEK